MMYSVCLPLIFFTSYVNAVDMTINVCNKPVQVPQPGNPNQFQLIQRPTVDPKFCFDLDPQACNEIFRLEMANLYAEQLDP